MTPDTNLEQRPLPADGVQDEALTSQPAPLPAIAWVYLAFSLAGAILTWLANWDFIQTYGSGFDLGLFLSLATLSAVLPSSSLALISAFLSSISSFTTEMCPILAASCNGLHPSSSLASISAPRSHKRRTISMWPKKEA